MAINITYEYICDICEKEARSKEVHYVIVNQTAPKPVSCMAVGSHLVCIECYELAKTPIIERIKKLAGNQSGLA